MWPILIHISWTAGFLNHLQWSFPLICLYYDRVQPALDFFFVALYFRFSPFCTRCIFFISMQPGNIGKCLRRRNWAVEASNRIKGDIKGMKIALVSVPVLTMHVINIQMPRGGIVIIFGPLVL